VGRPATSCHSVVAHQLQATLTHLSRCEQCIATFHTFELVTRPLSLMFTSNPSCRDCCIAPCGIHVCSCCIHMLTQLPLWLVSVSVSPASAQMDAHHRFRFDHTSAQYYDSVAIVCAVCVVALLCADCHVHRRLLVSQQKPCGAKRSFPVEGVWCAQEHALSVTSSRVQVAVVRWSHVSHVHMHWARQRMCANALRRAHGSGLVSAAASCCCISRACGAVALVPTVFLGGCVLGAVPNPLWGEVACWHSLRIGATLLHYLRDIGCCAECTC
jgi:hypothetical protein